MRDTWKVLGNLFAVVILSACLITMAFAAGYGIGLGRAEEVAPALVAATPPPHAPEPLNDHADQEFALFWEAWALLQNDYYGDLPSVREAARFAIKGVVQGLDDPSTVLIDPELARVLREDITGQFEGIGAVVGMEGGMFTIIEPYEDSPASRSGIKAGDIVLEVDGRSIEGMTTTEVISLIRGPEGTTVNLLIYRSSERKRMTFEVVRARIEIRNIEARMLDEGVAYIRLREFNARAPDQVRDALKQALSEEPTGIIFDLRGNLGGLLDSSIMIASQFIEEGVILEERFRDGTVVSYRAEGGGLATDPQLPLVILVNGSSASASEIVAGAVQDRGRGILVGQKTFGKGSVQIPHVLSDGSQLRITIARFYTPSGVVIHLEGLTPDIEVPMTIEDVDAGEDPQLERALEEILKPGREPGDEKSVILPVLRALV